MDISPAFSDLSVGALGILLRGLRNGVLLAADAFADGKRGEFVDGTNVVNIPLMRQIEAEILSRGVSIRHPSFGPFIPFELTEPLAD